MKRPRGYQNLKLHPLLTQEESRVCMKLFVLLYYVTWIYITGSSVDLYNQDM